MSARVDDQLRRAGIFHKLGTHITLHKWRYNSFSNKHPGEGKSILPILKKSYLKHMRVHAMTLIHQNDLIIKNEHKIMLTWQLQILPDIETRLQVSGGNQGQQELEQLPGNPHNVWQNLLEKHPKLAHMLY